MKRLITSLFVVISISAYGQWKILGVTIDSPKMPKITIGPKPLESFNKNLQKVFDQTGKLIPSEAKALTTKLFGESVKISGDLLQVYNDNNQLISNISIQTINLYQDITEPVDQNLLKIKSASLSTLGVTLPPDIDNAMSNYIKLNKNEIEELEKIYAKSVDIQDDVLKGTAKTLDDFGRYLLLTTNGFPKKVNMPELTKGESVASINISADLLTKIVDRILQNDIKMTKNTSYDKPFQVISVKDGSLKIDKETNSLLLELTDAKIKHNQPSVGMRLASTINVKKLRTQVIIKDSGDGSINLKLHLVYLDIDNLLPKLDETLCYYLQDAILSKFSQDFKLTDLVNLNAKVVKSDVPFLNFSTENLKTKFYLGSNNLGILYQGASTNNTIDVSDQSKAASVVFKDNFLKTLINEALHKTNGVRISLDKKHKDFNQNRNHYRIEKLNYIQLNDNGSIDIGAVGSIHLRKFLGSKPKINLLFSNIGFRLIPTLKTDSTSAKIEITLVPIADSLVVTGSPLKAKMLRKLVKLFKVSRTPITLSPADLEKTRSFNFESPFDPAVKLLPIKREMGLITKDNQWELFFNF